MFFFTTFPEIVSVCFLFVYLVPRLYGVDAVLLGHICSAALCVPGLGHTHKPINVFEY